MTQPPTEAKKPWYARILPYAAIIVSFVAVGLAVWEGLQTREHNRKSVMPALSFRAELSGNFYIENNGIGPARIDKYKVFFDGKEREPNWNFFENLPKEIGMADDVKPIFTIVVGKNVHVRAGRELLLFGFDPKHKMPSEENVHKLNGLLRFKIYYCSMYGECQWGEYP